MIENTAGRDPRIHLLGAMSHGTSGYIHSMEADGQQQLVNSTDLPTAINRGSTADFEAAGFTLGDPHEHDPLFRPATMPHGWKREASDHDMWSYIVDEHGRRRVSIFYKAAFYDRRAGMSLATPSNYLSSLLEEDSEPVLDDVWLTRDVAVHELKKIRDGYLREAEEADGFSKRDDRIYWLEQAVESRRKAARAGILITEMTPIAGG